MKKGKSFSKRPYVVLINKAAQLKVLSQFEETMEMPFNYVDTSGITTTA